MEASRRVLSTLSRPSAFALGMGLHAPSRTFDRRPPGGPDTLMLAQLQRLLCGSCRNRRPPLGLGHVALAVDSLGPRAITSPCGVPVAQTIEASRRAAS